MSIDPSKQSNVNVMLVPEDLLLFRMDLISSLLVLISVESNPQG